MGLYRAIFHSGTCLDQCCRAIGLHIAVAAITVIGIDGIPGYRCNPAGLVARSSGWFASVCKLIFGEVFNNKKRQILPQFLSMVPERVAACCSNCDGDDSSLDFLTKTSAYTGIT